MRYVSAIGTRWIFATILLALVCAFAAAHVARTQARNGLKQSVLIDARLRALLLDSEIARFRLVPLTLSDDRDVVATLAGVPNAPAALNRKLDTLAQTTGAAVIYLVGRSGRAIAASNWSTPATFVGRDFDFRRYVRDARHLGAAAQFARGTVSHRPGLYLSRRTSGADGVVVVKLEFDDVENDWAHAGGDTIVRDPHGIVLVSSRPAWRFSATRPLSAHLLAAVREEASLPPGSLRPLPFSSANVAATVPTAHPGWTLTLIRSASAAERTASRIAGLGAALAIVTLAALVWGLRQRNRLIQRRTAELEDAVTARTIELTREIDERAASEARAADLREGLRQANRLATLGQVTASVAHETAQPVAAIRTYAKTSATLIERGETVAVLANLNTIARLCDRIGSVTQELRGFARRRSGELRPISPAAVVDGALLILKEQLRQVKLECDPVDPDLTVIGGRVRLEQVLVNVLQNALEALRGTESGCVTLKLHMDERHVVLKVTDNGPGVPEDVLARLFTPFVTSRAEGLGLGLVIAHDIMIEMGGTLRHVPGQQGAIFEIEMVRA